MNVKMLNRIIRHIEKDARRFMMVGWRMERDSTYPQRPSDMEDDASKQWPPCGIVACIGGTAEMLDGRGRDARLVLALNDEQAGRLFYLSRWPMQFSIPYDEAKTPKRRVEIAVKRIRHFIKTEGWE